MSLGSITILSAALIFLSFHKSAAQLDDYLNVTEAVYSEDSETLTISFIFETRVELNVEYVSEVTVVDQPDCLPQNPQTGDYYTYVFTYGDGDATCQGQTADLPEEEGFLRTRYFATLNFKHSTSDVLLGEVITLDLSREIGIIVSTKPSTIPVTLDVTTPEPLPQEVMTGTAVNLVVGFTDTATVWDGILIDNCNISNNPGYTHDPELNLYSEIAFTNGCPRAISTGAVLAEQTKVTFTQAGMEWTVVGFVYGDNQVLLQCEVLLCDVRSECDIQACNGGSVGAEADQQLTRNTVLHAVEFAVDGVQYPSTTTLSTETTTVITESTTEPTTQTTEPTTQPEEPTTQPTSEPSTEEPASTTPATNPSLALTMFFYSAGSPLVTSSAVEGDNIQIRVRIADNSVYKSMLLESCQISNNAGFNYIPDQDQFTDNFILENCPQMSFMEVHAPQPSEDGRTLNINIKAFKYNTETTVHFRCNVIGCSDSDIECQPENECIANEGRRRDLLSMLRIYQFGIATGTLEVVDDPSGSGSAECPEGEVCTETPQFASMIGVLGGLVLLAILVIGVEVYRVAKFKQKLKYERRPYIEGYENFAAPSTAGGNQGAGRGYTARAPVY